MDNILFIAPTKEMENNARRILKHEKGVEFCTALIDTAFNEVEKRRKKIDVILSRGGTALKLIEQEKNIPVVEIPVTVMDVLEAVNKAINISKNIGFIKFSNIPSYSNIVREVFKVEPRVFNILHTSETIKYIREATSEGIKVILGGALTVKYAEMLGVESVLIKWSDESVQEAFTVANWISEIQKQEIENAGELKAILNSTEEGLITLDRNGVIEEINPAGSQIIKLPSQMMIGKKIDTIIKGLDFNGSIPGFKTISNAVATINYVQILANYQPIIVGQDLVGGVISFRRTSNILEDERRLRSRTVNENHQARYKLKDIIGCSEAIQKIKVKAERYAKSNSTILIYGETGTGKEMLAHGIHCASGRSNGPFISVNCAAFPETLLQAELFGYEEGAFTGSRKGGKPGLFIQANQGTIFLDEIESMSFAMQTYLLRVLQEKEVRPVGSRNIIPVNIRVIASTNEDLWGLVQKGQFRKDLFYRLNTLNLRMPPLRERSEDIPLLLRYFINTNQLQNLENVLKPDFMEILLEYSWPGNVRELRNFIHKLSVINHDGELTLHKIKSILKNNIIETSDSKEYVHVAGTLQQIREQLAAWVLQKEKGNKQKAAKKLGISATYLRKLIDKGGSNEF
ncbi:MAG: hypothetical protein PWQ96_1553 [Clostridia bacterium]|jgi:propionate catabolism operon transcriptional regulator|nr:propanediol utilization protein [Clostridiales bacterium]MDK2985910.1 hypothetical protein [Clostridia bacterium]